MKMKRLIYFIPLLLIGCKEAPKEYYSAGEVKVIEPVNTLLLLVIVILCLYQLENI